MILVDTSVWIDFFRGTSAPEAEWLDAHLAHEEFVIGDLILAEVLQGFREDRAFNEARQLMASLPVVTLGGEGIAVAAARNYRKLRTLGVTPRGTVDVIIATRCIVDGLRLLHCDRDFDPFKVHLKLQVIEADA